MPEKDPEQLYKNKITLKQRWTNSTNTYIKTFPDSALGIDTSGQNDRAYANIVSVESDINIFVSNLKGLIDTHANFLKMEDKRIATIKTKYNNSKVDLTTELSNNNAGKPLKIDKYDDNTKSYIYTSYYTVGILSMSYFIYKQLKQ
jgi:hypothetical protein